MYAVRCKNFLGEIDHIKPTSHRLVRIVHVVQQIIIYFRNDGSINQKSKYKQCVTFGRRQYLLTTYFKKEKYI